MRIEELDDPRANNALRAAVMAADAALAMKEANEEAVRFWRSPDPNSAAGFLLWNQEKLRVRKEQDEAHRDFCYLLGVYEDLLKELGKHEQVAYYAEPPGEEKAGPPAEAER